MSLPKLFGFGYVLLQKPLLILPIYKATLSTLKICNERYGNTHHGRGKANAFRHALWNFIICRKTLKFTKNKQKSVNWTKKVVNYYEKVTKNELLDRAMDYHNNTEGRDYFLENFDELETKTIEKLQFLAKNAQKVAKIDDFGKLKGSLVYIE